jgi:segregation and condensation protein B
MEKHMTDSCIENQDIEKEDSPDNDEQQENTEDQLTDIESDEQLFENDLENENDDAAQQDDQVLEPEEDIETTVESVLEAILFASDEPLTLSRLANIAELEGTRQVTQAIKDLNERYRNLNSAFRIEKIAGGYQMLTMPIYNSWLKKLLRARSDSKLSPAALETLAIVAYKQPIIRADVEMIRGVACGEVLRSLMYKGLVKIIGRAQVLGRPMLYGTTKKFLQVFGLDSLKDLPKVEELKKVN